MLNRTGHLFVVGPAPLRNYLQGVMDTTELGLPFPIEFVDVGLLDGTELLPDFHVRPTTLSHRIPSFAYIFTERTVERKLDSARLEAAGVAPGEGWGRLRRGEDVRLADGRVLRALEFLLPPRKARKIIVAGDNDRPELLLDEARDADVLVHEATYTDEVLRKVGPGPQHSSARMTASAAAAAGLPNLVLTHFSPRYQDEGALTIQAIEDEARSYYDGKLFLARDFDRYVLDRQGKLAIEG